MNNKPLELSAIIVSYNVRDLLAACLRSVYDTCREVSMQVIVVDNASTDGSGQMVRERFPEAILIENTANNGFARANNQGYEVSSSEYILLLNPDTVVKPGAVRTVLEFMKNTLDAGLVGCRLVNEHVDLQRSVKRMPSVGGNVLQALFLDRIFYPENRNTLYYRDRPFRVGYISGAFMMVRRSAVGDAPLLNEEYFMYAEEKDLALRFERNGDHCYFVPGAEIMHYGGKSTDQMSMPMFLELQKSQVKFFNAYYHGLMNWSLRWSYWLVLLTHSLVSLAIPFSKYGRHRIRLFFVAVLHYPGFIHNQRA